MIPPHLGLSPESFTKAFPFHFIFNRDLEIIQAGQVLQRVTSQSIIGSKIEHHFQIERPNIAIDFDAICKKSRLLFILEFIHNGMQIKGQMIYEQENDLIFFLGSPWITDTASLAPLGIKIKDFAIHDPIVDFLFLLQAKNTSLADAEKLTAELIHQRTQLQNALQIKEHLAKIAAKQAQQLELSLKELKQTQAQLVQAEKMSGLGQMVAGIAHEINNPVSFIYGNLEYIEAYSESLLNLVNFYQQCECHHMTQIKEYIEEIDLEFLIDDLPTIINSMKNGAERISKIVLSLRNFSRLDESEIKKVDLHEGMDSTLLILQHRLKSTANIEIIKNYNNLPLVECFPGQLNQVFMNIISNAIDALDNYNNEISVENNQNSGQIIITTEISDKNSVIIRIADNGSGITEEVKAKLFDPFFTTKPIGKGTGLGLSISYQIVVEKHKGKLWCESELGRGTEFWIEIPLSVNSKARNKTESVTCAI
ncbi:MAG: ATP-binding protein [Nostocaceae cyanobacterium]|nr:ATP-binding protein [Nostocaceae cyanobacterium]